MTPASLNLVVYRGTTLGPITIECKDEEDAAVDLTGHTAHAQVRVRVGAEDVFLDLEPTIPNPPTDGKIQITKTDEQTEALEPMIGVWDLLLETPTGEILGPYLEGTFKVARRPVTRTS